MPAGSVRPRASQTPPLSAGAKTGWIELGWQITEGGNLTDAQWSGPCARCALPCCRYGPYGCPLCRACRPPPTQKFAALV